MNLSKFKSPRARLAMLGLAALAIVLVVVAVTTSGGSGSDSTNTTTSSPAAASASAGTSASRTAFAQCMKEHGVTITPHAGASGAPRAHTGTPPAGIGSGSSSPTREAAFKACGAPGQHTGASHP